MPLETPADKERARQLLQSALALIEPREATNRLDAQRASWPDWLRNQLANLDD